MRDHQAVAAELLHFGRLLVADGLVVGTGGNISARLDTHDEILITPSGHSLAELDPADLVRLDLEGKVLGGRARPSSEWQMHVETYKARPDVRAVLHLHPPISTMLHAIGRPIRLMTTDHSYYVREIRSVPYIYPGTQELAEAIAGQLDGADVVLVQFHGCLLAAADMAAARQRALNLEAAAAATYQALLLGDGTTACPPEFLQRMRDAEASGVTHGRH